MGGYERIDGSFDHERVSLYFTGKVLEGEWMMEKIRKRSRHRSWALTPVAT